MSKSKSFFGGYHEVVHVWARIQVFDQAFKIHTLQTCS